MCNTHVHVGTSPKQSRRPLPTRPANPHAAAPPLSRPRSSVARRRPELRAQRDAEGRWAAGAGRAPAPVHVLGHRPAVRVHAGDQGDTEVLRAKRAGAGRAGNRAGKPRKPPHLGGHAGAGAGWALVAAWKRLRGGRGRGGCAERPHLLLLLLLLLALAHSTQRHGTSNALQACRHRRAPWQLDTLAASATHPGFGPALSRRHGLHCMIQGGWQGRVPKHLPAPRTALTAPSRPPRARAGLRQTTPGANACGPAPQPSQSRPRMAPVLTACAILRCLLPASCLAGRLGPARLCGCHRRNHLCAVPARHVHRGQVRTRRGGACVTILLHFCARVCVCARTHAPVHAARAHGR